MSEKYRSQSTSNQSAKVEDRVISVGTSTRKILKPQLVDNHNDPEACVKISIVHQKAVTKNEFQDIESVPLNKYKAGDIGKLHLDSAETKKLFLELSNLYEIHKTKGVPSGTRSIVVGFDDEVIKTDSKRAGLINALLSKGHSEEVWMQLVESDPDLATKLSLSRLQQTRVKHLDDFYKLLKMTDATENNWQKFFEKCTWIFGYALNYKFLQNIVSQPSYGGKSVLGQGENKGDILNATSGDSRFTVLIEIKKPTTELLKKEQYRNDCYSPSDELSGGLSQLRINAKRWEIEGSKTEKNKDILEAQNIFTVRPKQILIIGNLSQISSRSQRESFELFRRGQNDVEILTYDEVYARAQFIVTHEDSGAKL